MKKVLFLSIVIILSLLPSSVTASTPTYTITDLGTLGGTYSNAGEVNEKGHVVGHSSILGGEFSAQHAFFYDGASMHDLGTLGGMESFASSINDKDQIVGHSFFSGDTINHAFLYDGSILYDLGTLGGTRSAAISINNNGQVVGRSRLTGDSVSHAFLYDGTTMHDLGTLGGRESIAYDINNSGQVVGWSRIEMARGHTHAFLYENSTMHDLGTLGGPYSGAYGINENGQVVGWSNITVDSLTNHAFLYKDSAMHDLGTLGGEYSAAFAINNNEDIVGVSSTEGNLTNHAFLYTKGAMVDLNNFLPSVSGWELLSAHDINNSGQIVGRGLIGGEQHAFLMTPVPDNAKPAANIGENQTIYAWIDGLALAQLDGMGSYDPDGNPLEYFWFIDSNEIATGAKPNALLPVGEHVIDLIVNDGTEDSEPNSCVITVLPAIEMDAKLTPQALNRKSKRPHVIGRLELPGLTEADLDPNEPMVLMPGDIVAERVDILTANDEAESITLMGFFDNAALMEAIIEDGNVEVIITAKLISGQWVYGRDVVRVH